MKVRRTSAVVISSVAVALALAGGAGGATAAPVTGAGELRLGMSEAEALATGQLTTQGLDDALGCHTYSTSALPDTESAVVISPTGGVARVTLPSSFRTLEGIGVGSTAGEIRDTYVKASENRLGFTLFPSNTSTGYLVFLVSGEGGQFLDTDQVTRVRTQLLGSECFLG